MRAERGWFNLALKASRESADEADAGGVGRDWSAGEDEGAGAGAGVGAGDGPGDAAEEA